MTKSMSTKTLVLSTLFFIVLYSVILTIRMEKHILLAGLIHHPAQNALHGVSIPKTRSALDDLVDIFDKQTSGVVEKKWDQACQNPSLVGNSCEDGNCLRMAFSPNARDRIGQLVENPKLTIPANIREALNYMSDQVKGRVDLLFITAASSDHFLEAQGLIQSLHVNVFPHLSNFSFVFYSLGLEPGERQQLVKHCRCQVIDFPFQMFPEFARTLKCYSWKSAIVHAHIHQARHLMWLDASIRLDSDPSYLASLRQKLAVFPVQVSLSFHEAYFQTLRSTYHYFGDEPCVFYGTNESQAGLVLYANEYFVQKAILDPWVACSMIQSCICPVPPHTASNCTGIRPMLEKYRNKTGPLLYGMCHRFDQSVLTTILKKLYPGHYHLVTFKERGYKISIRRGHRVKYFDALTKPLQTRKSNTTEGLTSKIKSNRTI